MVNIAIKQYLKYIRNKKIEKAEYVRYIPGNLEPELLHSVLKAVGIGLLAELTGQICADSGNASLGKSLQILATAVILWLMLPLFTQLIDLLEEILGAI